jgi:hypothetical protein
MKRIVNNIFDINHVFIIEGGDEYSTWQIFIPFREISYVTNTKSEVFINLKCGRSITVNEVGAFEFMEEYKGCVGLETEAEKELRKQNKLR